MVAKLKAARRAIVSLAISFLIVLLPGFSSVHAEDEITQAIIMGDVNVGEVNLSRVMSRYTFTGEKGNRIYLRTQSLTPDFAVEYRLTDENGQLLAQGNQLNGQPGSLSIIELTNSGTFTVQMQSANGKAGQFSVSVEHETASD